MAAWTKKKRDRNKVTNLRTKFRIRLKDDVHISYISDFEYRDILKLYTSDEDFRRSVDSGHYAFVDGKIVLNSKKYISFDEGRMHLKPFSKVDDSLYCLHYKIETQTSINVTTRCMRQGYPLGHREKPNYKKQIKKVELEDAKRINSVNDVTLENMISIVGGGHDPGEDFSTALKRFMKESDITEERLAELTGLSTKTIQRMRTPSKHTSLRSVIAVCVALHLDLYNGMYLVSLAGFELTNKTEDRVFRFILGFAYKESVYDCNRMLERLGMRPLTEL